MRNLFETVGRWVFHAAHKVDQWWSDTPYPGLTEDEFQEYEFLGESMEWRALSRIELERFNQLDAKKDKCPCHNQG